MQKEPRRDSVHGLGFGLMCDENLSGRFLLIRLGQRNWVIQRHASARVGEVVAHIQATFDRDLEVVDVAWEFPCALPVRYATAEEVLADIELGANRPHATKPIPIAHFPPPTTKTRPTRAGVTPLSHTDGVSRHPWAR